MLCEDTQYAADSFLPELQPGTVCNGNAASRWRSCPWSPSWGPEHAPGGALPAGAWGTLRVAVVPHLPWDQLLRSQPENGTKWHQQMKETTGKHRVAAKATWPQKALPGRQRRARTSGKTTLPLVAVVPHMVVWLPSL